MEKFTDRLNESIQEQPKFVDKLKQEIYLLLKENVKILEPSGEKMLQIEDDEIYGIDELTDKLYNFVQKEKLKEEILTLESIKTIFVAGPFNFTNLNEQIDQLKKKLNN